MGVRMVAFASARDVGGGSGHQRAIDAVLASVCAEDRPVRPSLFKPPPPRPAPSRDLLDHSIAEELAAVTRRLEQLGAVLAADPILLQRHAAQLQSIDLIQQLLGHLAHVISTEQREIAINGISLIELKARLKRTPLVR